MPHPKLHIHLVSDSTGETVHQVARAALSQFPDVQTYEHIWTWYAHLLMLKQSHLH